ncbi:MAG: CDP-alcohol phosphatidyltransferase family protein [Candidatus Eremiobacteraeota bacterium]|nr:CDP-alcohol phosphatidyltransferase family protein [Candidatus Eremiobacteraeota bacterium]
MLKCWEWIKTVYLRIIDPFADWLVRHRVGPNTITTIGTLTYIAGGVIYASGHVRTAGWWLGLTAMFDVLDGKVARASGRSTVFGAFYDSTLDRVADGAVLGGLAVLFARNSTLQEVPHWAGTPMVTVTLFGIVGTFLTSYTRARAESLGLDAKVGLMQRPERVVLLSAPQALFGLALDGYVLMGIVTLLSVTAWITAVQRVAYVHRVTRAIDAPPNASAAPPAPVIAPPALAAAPRAPNPRA